MIKLGKLTDYAIVVMVQLAKEGEGVSRSASQLADLTGLPEPTVAKVLKTLQKGSLVSSARGAQGGYRLARDPETLSVRDIVEAVDGPIAIVTCIGGQDHCHTGTQCPTRGRWEPVNSAIRAALAGITLAGMASAGPACAAARQPLVQATMPAQQGKA